MKRFNIWLPALALAGLVTILGFTMGQGGNPSAVASPLTGKAAPPLDVPTLGGEGPRLTIDSFKGKPHLLNFFASWCGPCAAENQLLVTISEKHVIEIDGVAMKDDPDALKLYLTKRGNPYTGSGSTMTGGRPSTGAYRAFPKHSRSIRMAASWTSISGN